MDWEIVNLVRMFFLARAVQTSFLSLKIFKINLQGHKCQAVTVPGGPATTLIYGLKSINGSRTGL